MISYKKELSYILFFSCTLFFLSFVTSSFNMIGISQLFIIISFIFIGLSIYHNKRDKKILIGLILLLVSEFIHLCIFFQYLTFFTSINLIISILFYLSLIYFTNNRLKGKKVGDMIVYILMVVSLFINRYIFMNILYSMNILNLLALSIPVSYLVMIYYIFLLGDKEFVTTDTAIRYNKDYYVKQFQNGFLSLEEYEEKMKEFK